jgi:hypothetical protein
LDSSCWAAEVDEDRVHRLQGNDGLSTFQNLAQVDQANAQFTAKGGPDGLFGNGGADGVYLGRCLLVFGVALSKLDWVITFSGSNSLARSRLSRASSMDASAERSWAASEVVSC